MICPFTGSTIAFRLAYTAWQRAVLAWFVEAEWLDQDAAAGMLAWPHSGFGVHVGPAIAGEDREALVRVRYYGAYATRRRVWWQRRGISLAGATAVAEAPLAPAADWPALRARKRRWAELLRLVFKVEIDARAGPWTGAAAEPG